MRSQTASGAAGPAKGDIRLLVSSRRPPAYCHLSARHVGPISCATTIASCRSRRGCATRARWSDCRRRSVDLFTRRRLSGVRRGGSATSREFRLGGAKPAHCFPICHALADECIQPRAGAGCDQCILWDQKSRGRRECRAKRPLRLEDPTDGTHRVVNKTIRVPLVGQGKNLFR